MEGRDAFEPGCRRSKNARRRGAPIHHLSWENPDGETLRKAGELGRGFGYDFESDAVFAFGLHHNAVWRCHLQAHGKHTVTNKAMIDTSKAEKERTSVRFSTLRARWKAARFMRPPTLIR